MRAVTQAAETSVSAANYHFGSKEALLAAALTRRLEPLNRRRLEALAALEKDPAPPTVRAIVEAFLRPSFEAQYEGGNGRAPYRHVAAQLYADPNDRMAALKLTLFVPVVSRFIDALERALPDRSREDLLLNFQLVIGVMIHVISGHADRVTESGERLPADEEVLEQAVAFAAAGMSACRLTPSGARTAGGPA